METTEKTMGAAALAELERGLGKGRYTVMGPRGEVYVMEGAEAAHGVLEATYVRAERWNGGGPREEDRTTVSIELTEQVGERDIPDYRNGCLDSEEYTVRPCDEGYDTDEARDMLDRLVGLHGAMAGTWWTYREWKPGGGAVREYWGFCPAGGGIAARPTITEAA